jgi:hypothetical protein
MKMGVIVINDIKHIFLSPITLSSLIFLIAAASHGFNTGGVHIIWQGIP